MERAYETSVHIKKGNKNKKQNNFKVILPVIIALLIVIVIAVVMCIIYFTSRDGYKYENVITPSNYSETDIRASNPIVIGNILMGSWLKDKWIPAEQFTKYINDLTGTKAMFFDDKGKMSDNELGVIKKEGTCYWVSSNTANNISGYVASTGTLDMVPRKSTLVDINSTDLESYNKKVKEVINSKGILNDTVKIYKVLKVELAPGEKGEIVVASNNGNSSKGVYSAVIYLHDGKTEIVKLDYNNDEESKDKWSFYDVLYVLDINNDSVLELVLQEVKGTNIKQSIVQYKDSKFYEVLSVEYSL